MAGGELWKTASENKCKKVQFGIGDLVRSKYSMARLHQKLLLDKQLNTQVLTFVLGAVILIDDDRSQREITQQR